MKTFLITVMVVAMLLLTACSDPGAKQAKGFRLPPGDENAGKGTFVTLNCHTCHTVDGVTLPEPPSKGQYSVKLGGKVHRVRTYGDLVTAIVHPAHDITKPFKSTLPAEKLGEEADKTKEVKSPMPDYNHVITAQQLIDLTSFLHGRYSQMPQEDYTYYF